MSNATEIFRKIQAFIDQQLSDLPNDEYYEVIEEIHSDMQSRLDAHDDEMQDND